jgi:hypothetical protein
MDNISRSIVILIVLIFLFFGLTDTNYTGNVINSLEKNPLVAAEFNYEDYSFSKDVHKKIISGQYSLTNVDKGKYLVLRWNKEVTNLNIIMKGHSKFEIWSEGNILIASGTLDGDNFKEYNFELNSNHPVGDYALFNYGPEDIIIDSITGIEVPESKLEKVLELIAEGFI